MMDRRTFIGAVASGLITVPFTARGQQARMPLIGFLNGFSATEWALLLAEFRSGLNEAGYVEGRNVAIEYRWAEGHFDRLPSLASELVRRQVTAIVATGGSTTATAAKAATSTIPIIFGIGSDPVKLGLVASLNRPGGNATGVFFLTAELEGKRLGLLREIVPTTAPITVLLNPKLASFDARVKSVRAAASAVGQQIQIVHASDEREIDAAFATFAQLRAAALLVGADPFFLTQRDRIAALAARQKLPAIYEQREFAVAGGLMSYGTSLTDATRRVGIYAGRVLKGEKPADLPVVQSDKFELVINLKTAKALGLEVPPSLLARVDEVIE
jgi:putative ABC transport system substrate-binding protein